MIPTIPRIQFARGFFMNVILTGEFWSSYSHLDEHSIEDGSSYNTLIPSHPFVLQYSRKNKTKTQQSNTTSFYEWQSTTLHVPLPNESSSVNSNQTCKTL